MRQRTPQWHAARLGHITGSRCAPLHVQGRKGDWGTGAVTLMRQLVGELLTRRPAGFRPVWLVDGEEVWRNPLLDATPAELEQRHGGDWVSVVQPVDYREPRPSDAQAWGIAFESLARQRYEAARGKVVDEAAWVAHRTERYIGVSPDGFVGIGGLVEIKCPYTEAAHLATVEANAVPSEYMPQILHQLWLTGRSWCDFVSFDPRQPDGLDLWVIRVERDKAAIDWHAERCISFRDDMLRLAKKLEGRQREQLATTDAT